MAQYKLKVIAAVVFAILAVAAVTTTLFTFLNHEREYSEQILVQDVESEEIHAEAQLTIDSEVPQENLASQRDENQPQSSNYIYITAALLAILSLVTSTTSLWLYRSRVNLNISGALVPEKWASIIMEVVSSTNKSTQQAARQSERQEKLAAYASEGLDSIAKDMQNTQNMLLDFQKALNEKDRQIDQLEKGRDFLVLKKFIEQVIDLHQQAHEYAKSDPRNKLLKSFCVLLEQLIEDQGIEIGWPQIGSKFEQQTEVAESAGTVELDGNKLENGTIVEVLSPYYFYLGQKYKTVIRKSKVKYVYREGL